jgi:hypothetical protein
LQLSMNNCEFKGYIPYYKTVQTLALRGRINILDPEVADGVAREDCTDDRPARVGGNESDQPVADLAEALLWKNPEVLEQDGQFGAKEGRVVDPEAGPEPFAGPYDFVFGECALVTTGAVYDCSRLVDVSRFYVAI